MLCFYYTVGFPCFATVLNWLLAPRRGSRAAQAAAATARVAAAARRPLAPRTHASADPQTGPHGAQDPAQRPAKSIAPRPAHRAPSARRSRLLARAAFSPARDPETGSLHLTATHFFIRGVGHGPTFRAISFPKVTKPLSRLPAPALFYRPEFVQLEDLLRFSVRHAEIRPCCVASLFTGRSITASLGRTSACDGSVFSSCVLPPSASQPGGGALFPPSNLLSA